MARSIRFWTVPKTTLMSSDAQGDAQRKKMLHFKINNKKKITHEYLECMKPVMQKEMTSVFIFLATAWCSGFSLVD